MLKGKKEKNIDVAVQSLNCTHDWQYVQTRNQPKDTDEPSFHELVLCYCPLCKNSQIFTKQDWDAILKIQDIEKKYKR